MPIFDNELLGNNSNREYDRNIDVPLGSTADAAREIDTRIGLDIPGQYNESFQGITADQAKNFKGGFAPMSPNSPFSMVSKSELLANQRYPLYERGVDLENIYGLQQSGLSQIGNGLIKAGALALGSFGQSFATIPNTISALRKGDISELSGKDGYEATIDTWTKNLEDYFPNYVTRYEKERGLATAIPFTYGSANFWGDKIIKNTGFMVGAIAGALVQDAAIGFVTKGIGAVPLVASQLGKASLYLNKLFTGVNKVDKVLDLARAAGKSEQVLLNINKLGQLAAADKLTSGFRYTMSVYGSARTEAAIESRESYTAIKEQLTEAYRLENFGQDPIGEDFQQIEDYATNAMNTRFGINMALLTVSNAVQFDNLFKSFTSSQKGLTSSMGVKVQDLGKIGLKEGSLDVFEKKLPSTIAAKVWDSVKPRALNIITEGVYEEGGQFAAQKGVEDYYTRKYKNKESWDFVKEAMTSTTKGMAEQFGSSEGLESMIIGGITAALTGEGISLIDKAKGRGKNKRLDTALSIMNQYGMTGILSDKYADTSRGLEISKQMQEAVKSNNIFKYKNLKSDMLFNFVSSRVPLGMHDVTIEQLNMLKELPKDEFEKTFGMDFSTSNKETVGQYVDNIISKAENIKDTVEGVNSMFKNPYQRIIDPKTDDERIDQVKHSIFENWKKDLSSLSVIQQDVDSRLSDIQSSVNNISPLVNTSLLSMLSSDTGLKELTTAYEQKANLLSESLSLAPPSERESIRTQIKKLRTLSEKISLAMSSETVDSSLFNTLLNFELNYQDFSKANLVSLDKSQKLSEYSEDINKLKNRKINAEKSFDNLTSEKGFDNYFTKEEESRAETEEEVNQELSAPEVKKYEFVNKFNKSEIPSEGREYQLANALIAKVKKAGDQYKVTSPTGEVTYHDTKEKADQVAADLNIDFSELTKVKILKLNEDGTLKVEDLSGNIQNINPRLLKGYEKLQTEEEKLGKDKEVLDRELEKLSPTVGSVESVPSTPGEIVGSEDKRPDVDRVFLKTTSPSEDLAGEEVENTPHIKRSRYFLNNFKFFKNRNKIKVIIVTDSNAKELGLDGIIQLSWNKNLTDALPESEQDVDQKFMAQVFITQTPDGDFFVNEKGEKLSKVGEDSADILDNVVFQKMTSASLTTDGGYSKIRKGQELEAEIALAAYKIFRANQFKEKGYTPYPFAISRGIANQLKINGVYENNHMSDILGPNGEEIIAKHDGLLEVVVDGKIEHDGEISTFPNGTTLIRYGDLLDFANNKEFTNRQANNAFSVINALAKDLIAKSSTAGAGKPNLGYITYLKNILYFKIKGSPTSSSQISLDTTTMEFKIGNKSFPLSKIEASKQEILDVLLGDPSIDRKGAFISINNKTLKEGVSKKFTEYVADKDGNLTEVVWPNYQSFLMSSKNPDGSNRSVGETPLITHTTKPTDNSNSYKQKYAYITDKNVLPYSEVPVKEVKAVPVQTKNKIGEYEVNTNTPQTFKLKSGDVLFTATLSETGEISVTAQTNDTIKNIATDPQKIKTIDDALKQGQSPEAVAAIDTKLSEDKVKLYFEAAIEQTLKKELEAQQAEAPQQVPVVSDIEKRREEDLQNAILFLINDGTYGGSKDFSLLEYLNIQAKENGEKFNIANWNYININGTGVFFIKKEGIAYIIPNNTYTKNPRVVKLFFNKGTQRIDLASPNINTPNLKQSAQNDNVVYEDLLQEIQSVIKPLDAELASLEGVKPVAPVVRKKRDSGEYREVGKDSSDRMTNSELEIFKQWHAENVPFIPFEVLERLVTMHNGEKAWGVFEDGVAKFVRGGLRGTEYHEIFEAIYADFLTDTEKTNLLNEFRNKKGEFTDRASGKKIAYADATDRQAKERIADDFSDFRLGKLPARSLGERVRNLFKRIMDFFKSFVAKPSLKDELFKAIDSGKFKETKLSERAKALAPEYRAIEGLTPAQTNGYVQDMVFQVKRIIFRDGQKELLFNPEAQTGDKVFSQVRQVYENLEREGSDQSEMEYLGEERYNELVKKSINFLRTLGISFNADEVVSINDENANSRDYAPETFSIDWKKNSTGALKFLLSTLSERKSSNQSSKEAGTTLVVPPAKMSEQGFKILNFNRVFATLLDRLHNTNDPVEFTKKFIELAKEDSNYLSLFTALGGNLNTHTFDFDTFGVDTDWRLFIQFFNTFSRQKPEALIQYVSEEGDVYTGPANIFTTVNKTLQGWIDNMKIIGKAKGGLISYDTKNRVYKIKSFVGRVEKSGNTWNAISPEGKITNHSTEKEARDVARSYDISIKKSTDQIKFLNTLGIEFDQGTYNGLSNRETIIKGKKTTELKEFVEAVLKIHTYLGKNNELMTFDAKRLAINGPLRTLATLYTKVNNPNQDSTYFGVEGQRIGAFSENNTPSYFENTFNESKTLAELLEKMPQLNDVYSRGSEVLKKGGLFFNADGERIATINVGYIQGSKNQITGKDKSTAKLSKGERFVQEINQNINGNYYILIPGDSSTEWMMNLGNVISMEDVISGKHWNQVYSIYNNYLNDEINLALEDRKQNIYQRAKSQELRIMKDVLSEDIVETIESMIKDGEAYDAIQEYISKNRENINSSIKAFIDNMSKETVDILISSNQIGMVEEDKYYLGNFDTEFLNKYNLSGKITFDELMSFINFVNINYTINNQEYHKILFGDPYQFKTEKGKLDETKRIKSFLSGRRRTFDMAEYNNKLKESYNTVDGIELDSKTPGYHDYKSYTNTVTFNTVEIVGSIATLPNIPKEIKDAFAKTDETDAMSWLMDNTHKEIALKEGQWPKQAEDFHQWQMAYTRRAFDKRKDIDWTYGDNTALKERDAKLLESDMPKYKLAVRKPIISGNKNNKTELDIVLDKTSQMPLYYQMVEGTSLGKIYEQMFDQNIGYGIVISGRKVGAEGLHNIYVDGAVNTAKFENIVEVPWKIYGTQVETISEGEKTQTRGSQPTKIVTSDLYDNGEPIGDTPERKEFIAKAVKRHDGALDMLNENGYNELLNKLGIVDLGDTYALEDKQAISETLMYEMMRRELSENAIDTIQLDKNGEFIMPFEASPSYTQIKSILYSMVSKAITSPQMSGSPHVQVPVTMFEKATEGRSFARKVDGNWVKISKDQYKALTEEEKKSVMLTDDTLKFYTKDAPYCEILLPHWFKGKFKGMSDEQILTYLNTPEGRKILTGIGFRIPTQSLSSIEIFRVKGFLPQYMGNTVVVPSEITTKAGSDFDIDKLNMYLKSIYVDQNGKVRLVKYLGSEEATKGFFRNVYIDSIQKDIDKIKNYDEFRTELFELFDKLEQLSPTLTEAQKNFYSVHEELINSIIDQADAVDMIPSEYISDQIKTIAEKKEKLTAKLLFQGLQEKFVRDMYKKSLENEYYESIEELVTLPENFIKLISPVNDAGLEKMSEVLDTARGYNESNIKGRLINRNFMTSLRHAFITGKRWVGIAAVNITNLSLRQKAKVYFDPSKLFSLSAQERKFVKDLSIVLPHNKIEIDGTSYVSLSGTRTADLKQLISERYSGYATAFVDIANKPFITKIIKSDTVVSTFMFLEAIGAGDAGIFFLNQPIIEKYLEYLDGIGSKSVMSKSNISYIKNLFPATQDDLANAKIDVSKLLDNIRYYKDNNLMYHDADITKNVNNQKFAAEQQLILDEFIKYKILADQLFSYTQATNYDTTKFGSSDLYLKKQLGTISVDNFSLISNVNHVLKNTFVGKLSDLLGKSFNSFGAIMKTEDPKIKAYMIETVKEYAKRKYMSADDYMKIANLINNSFIDYVIQNDRSFYNLIKPALVDSETAVVAKLEQAKQKYPSIQLLQELVPAIGNREGGAQSIELKANVKDVYSENLYVGMMRELRDSNPELNSLYNDIVNVAILQGVGQTAISIRNIIPVEDYAAKISPIINNLQPNINLESYSNGMFQRNNFNNEDVFPKFIPYVHTPKPNPKTKTYDERNLRLNPNTGEDELIYFIPVFKEMKGITKTSRRLIALNDVFNSYQLSSDYVKIPKVITNKEGLKINVTTGVEVTSKDYALMKQKGSQDLYDAYYYKKVYTDNIDQFGNRIPLKIYNKDIEGYDYYYKLINVHGDGPRAVEYNSEFGPSVINNGSMRIKEETNDRDIVNYFAPQIQEEVVPLPTKEVITSTSNKVAASIPQNKVSGVESYGSLTIANNEAIKMLGPNPHSIDMIETGLRTRTTRSESEMQKYSVKVGDVIRNIGKSADGTTKTIDAVVTAIHPKGSPGWKGTWEKEGWRVEDVNVIDRFKDGAAAIEFEVIKPTQSVTEQVVEPDLKNIFSQLDKPEGISQQEWDNLSQEEKNKINEC